MFDFKVHYSGNTVARLDCGDFIFTCRFYCGKYHAFNLDKDPELYAGINEIIRKSYPNLNKA